MKLLAAALLLAVSASPALAQQEDARDLAAQDCSRAKKAGKPCVLTFGKGETIEGGVSTGDGEGVIVREMSTFSSLIRIRTNFISEIIRAAEDL